MDITKQREYDSIIGNRYVCLKVKVNFLKVFASVGFRAKISNAPAGFVF